MSVHEVNAQLLREKQERHRRENMNGDLKKLQDMFSERLFGMSKDEAIKKGICIECKQPATFYSDAGKREYKLSGLCEHCFDGITEEGKAK